MRRVRYSVAMSLDRYVAGPTALALMNRRVYPGSGTVSLEYAVT